jgi:hypothetical protein
MMLQSTYQHPRPLGLEFSRSFSQTVSSTSFSAEKSKSAPVSPTNADTGLGRECRDQIPEIGLMEFRDDGAQRCRIGGMYLARDFFDELGTNFAIFVAHREIGESRGIGGLGNISSAMPRLTGSTELLSSSELSLHALSNRQHLTQ